MQRANELALRPAAELDAGLARLWAVMTGLHRPRPRRARAILPGGLKVRRRARGIHERLLAERGQNLTAPHTINDWISVYAIAVNEENAAGAQVVTAPTNGAAGVVPGDHPLLPRPRPRRLAGADPGVPADRRRRSAR